VAAAPDSPALPRTRRGVESRRRLLEAAAAELVEQAGALEVQRVARRCGVSVGLIYRYFSSRAGLVGAVVEDFYRRFERAVMVRNPLPGADWASRERERTRRSVAFHYADPLAPVVLARLHRDPVVAAIEAGALDRQIELAARNLALGQRRGELPRGPEPRLVAAMVLGGMQRGLVEALARSPRPPEHEVLHQLWRFVAGAVGLPRLARRM